MVIALIALSGCARGAPPGAAPTSTPTTSRAAVTASASPTQAQPPAVAQVHITRFPDPHCCDVAIDNTGAVVIAIDHISRPTWVGSPPTAQRYGFYEVLVTSPTPLDRFSVAWSQVSPAGSQFRMQSPGGSPYNGGVVNASGPHHVTVTLAHPEREVWITFTLFAGIDMPDTTLGPSPRLTSLTVSSPDATSLSAHPVRPGWAGASASPSTPVEPTSIR